MPGNRTSDPSRLWKWLHDFPATAEGLAWCHTTDAFTLRDIIHAGRCLTAPCKIFREDLLYFFYGRPAFRLADEELADSSKLPVVLIFEPSLVGLGTRIFPFDSGAFYKNRYERSIHPKMKISDFELICDDEIPRKHVVAFFRSNGAYLKTRAEVPIKNYSGEFEVSALVHLFMQKHHENTDDRRLALELQLDTSIDIQSTTLKAIIYPDELEQAPWLHEFIKSNKKNISFECYEVHNNKNARDYQIILENEAAKIQKKLGLLD